MDRAVRHCFWAHAVVRRLFFAHEEPPLLSRSRMVISQPQASVSSHGWAGGFGSGPGRAHSLSSRNRPGQRRIISCEPIYFTQGNHDELVDIPQSKRRHLCNRALYRPNPYYYQFAEQPSDALSRKSTPLVEAALLFARCSPLADWIVAG